MTYYLYHIPGKKIGVTCDLNNRVTVQQGYEPGEYEVLESSKDIDYISSKEFELQKEYGYRVDMVPYKNLNRKNMNINVTEQTTTFPCPIDKLKGRLFDLIGMEWNTEHGDFIITPESIKWIMKNVKTSMFNHDRSYVYNKAFAVWRDKQNVKSTGRKCSKKPLKMFENIREWAKERGIYDAKEWEKYRTDTPCTYAVQFSIIQDKLCMSVYMRSNDLWYGFCNDQYCFSMLQKLIAERLSMDVGWYYHHAHNMHIYNDKLEN